MPLPAAQVLNVDNSCASASLLLFFDQERYIFNVGEGMQRHMREYKVNLQKVGWGGDCRRGAMQGERQGGSLPPSHTAPCGRQRCWCLPTAS